jgi:hypothetical protein
MAPGDTIIKSPEEKTSDVQSSFFSCFSHPLLLPPDSLCGSTTCKSAAKEQAWIKPTNSFVDIHGEKQQEHNHAHVGASLLSAIKAKNSNENASKPNWKSSDKIFNNRFDTLTSLQIAADSEHPDVLSCTSRNSLKLKPVPSFEFVRAPSTNPTEGHLAMRRMILEKDGAMTSLGIRRSASANGFSTNYRGLAMRIEMDIHPGNASGNSSFSRSKGSFTNIDIKVRKGLKKRVSRTWISWAESWCMRLWEEEESHRLTIKANKIDGVSRKRKTNVRPSVRRIGEKREEAKVPPSNWNALDLDGRHSCGKWMFVRQSSEMEEEECGVEVTCEMNVSKVARKIPLLKGEGKDSMVPEEKETAKKSGVTGTKSRWCRSTQVKSKTENRR